VIRIYGGGDMREIKFRAWDKKAKNMWRVLRLPLSFLGGALLLHSYYDNGETMQEDKNIDDYILMQFTGLKDKNGKELFEGDIVKVFVSDIPEISGIFEVIWDSPMFRLVRELSLGKHFLPMNFEMEVIGNIYENPELLKKEEK
jgi:uncharacterized phage protein (TIGR01671 family)